jgi:hypothetical protein
MEEKFKEKFQAIFNEKKKELADKVAARTDDEFKDLGRLIHFHLLAEDALVLFIKGENPLIGDFEKGATQFQQKLGIAQNMVNGGILAKFNKPLQALNEVRNKSGHYPVIVNYPADSMNKIRSYFEENKQDLTGWEDLKIIEHFVLQFCGVIYAVNSAREVLEKHKKEWDEEIKKFSESIKEVDQLK